MDKEKEDKKSNIILIHDAGKDNIELTEEELTLKTALSVIETKIASIERIRDSIENDEPNSIFATEMFDTMIGAIAISAVSELLAEFFGLSEADLDTLI